MTASNVDAVALTPSEHQIQLRRAVIAATIGTAIEWYDFFLYSTVTGLVFAKLFFPHSDPWVGTLEAFAIYAVGFVARPVGAAIFGHYGDRIGRKSTLIATLMLMGLATFAVALVPTYASIGVWGAVILTVLRFIQGIGVGGEWGGSVLMSMEWARTDKSRGFIASWPQFGVPCGLFLANLAVLAFSQMSGEQFLAWGWRIPFALSLVLVALDLGRARDLPSAREGAGLAFVFGLVHGLGFAGGLSEIGLPDHDVSVALLGFAAGIEIGQVAFLAVVLVAFAWVASRPRLGWTVRAGATLIGGVSAYWLIERVIACFAAPA